MNNAAGVLQEIDKKHCQVETVEPIIRPFSDSLIPPDSWLKRYIDLVYPLTEAPKQYHIATALSIVATTLSRNVYLEFGAFTIYPNLWLLVIGESGTPRKSTAINFATRFLSPINRNVILGSLLSLEAAYEAFHTCPNRLALYDEIKLLLDNEDKKYGKGLITLFTSMYNCPPFVRVDLKSIPEAKRNIEKPCLNLLGATTTDWLQVKESDIEGGFFGRILPVCADNNDVRCLPFPPQMDNAKFNGLIDELRQMSQLRGETTLEDEARVLYEGLYRESKDDFEGEPDKTHLSTFYSRFSQHALKLAMIFQITTDRSLVIKKDNVLRAFACMNEFKTFYKRLISSLDFTWEQKKERKVLDIIREHRTTGVPHSVLLHKSKLSSKVFGSVIQTLSDKDLIRKEASKGTTKPLTIYYYRG